MTLDIGEVVARAGVPPSTLRYYEEKGLIAATGRRGLRRQYDASVLQTLALIALGRAAGFSLDDIAGMLLPQGKASRLHGAGGHVRAPIDPRLGRRARQGDRRLQTALAIEPFNDERVTIERVGL